jgi:methionyl aminopeptidase
MYRTLGEYINIDLEIRGVEPIFNHINIPNEYPDDLNIIKSLEYAAAIHKEVRRTLQPCIKPGIKLKEIAEIIELKTQELSNESKSINKGIGFPVGLSINECTAHWHPNSNDRSILKKDDIIKIDFGTEVNGWIIDSAFTISFTPKYDPLINAVKEATKTGIKNIGMDVNIVDWGKEIQEVMESYEIILDGKLYPIRSIRNLGGHNIKKGIIHGGMFLPIVNLKNTLPSNYRFKEGVYAVETFGSTGNNTVVESNDSNLYRINPNNIHNINELKLNSTKKLLNQINKSFSTLPFTDRYVETFNFSNYKTNLNILTTHNYLHSYPPLCVNKGAYTAQYEHTLYIDNDKKIVFSNGEDY